MIFRRGSSHLQKAGLGTASSWAEPMACDGPRCCQPCGGLVLNRVMSLPISSPYQNACLKPSFSAFPRWMSSPRLGDVRVCVWDVVSKFDFKRINMRKECYVSVLVTVPEAASRSKSNPALPDAPLTM